MAKRFKTKCCNAFIIIDKNGGFLLEDGRLFDYLCSNCGKSIELNEILKYTKRGKNGKKQDD